MTQSELEQAVKKLAEALSTLGQFTLELNDRLKELEKKTEKKK